MALGLVGDYNSGSEEEEEEAKNTKPSGNDEIGEWKKLHDESTGYPYYWNTLTNEVKWTQSLTDDKPERKSKTVRSPSSGKSGSRKSEKRGISKKQPVVYGPSVQEPTPEEIAISRIRKFEFDLADGIIKEIYKEVPGDWKKGLPSSILYTHPFKWNKNHVIAPNLEAKERVKGSKNAMDLIGGVYGNDSENDDDDEEEKEEVVPAKKSRKTISVTVKSSIAKKSTISLRPIPSAFQDEDNPSPRKSSSIKKMSSAGSSYKKSIDKIAETLIDKLEALHVESISISPLKLLAVQIETLFNAWQSGALSSSYLQKTLTEMNSRLLALESDEISPPGWKMIWDRYETIFFFYFFSLSVSEFAKVREKNYFFFIFFCTHCVIHSLYFMTLKDGEEGGNFHNFDFEISVSHHHLSSKKEYQYEDLITGEVQRDKPREEEDIEEDSDFLPPLPPNPPTTPPPLPPSSPPSDMELDEEENSKPIVVKEKPFMDSALDSFYNDIALLEESPNLEPPTSSEEQGEKEVEELEVEEEEQKRRKRTKVPLGLSSMKKKDLGNLVAKWNNLQEQSKCSK